MEAGRSGNLTQSTPLLGFRSSLVLWAITYSFGTKIRATSNGAERIVLDSVECSAACRSAWMTVTQRKRAGIVAPLRRNPPREWCFRPGMEPGRPPGEIPSPIFLKGAFMVRRKYPKAQEELVRKSFEQDPIIKRFPAAKITEVWQEIPDEVQDPPAEFQQQAFPVADSPKRPFEQPPPPTSPPGELAPPSDADYQMFEAIGVNRELVDLAGIHRIEDHQARDLGIYLPREASSGSLDGWAVPYYIYVDGERKRVGWVGRRDQGKPKYLCSKDKRHCYIPPTVTEADLADTSQPIIFVESEKSALMLAALFERFRDRISRRAIPMAVRGCTGWHMKVTEIQPDGTKQKKSGGVLDEITRYVTPGRVCLVLFDANWRKNSDVSREQAAFKRYLRSRSVKANAKVCYLPAGDWNGPDDYLAKCGDEAMFKILDGKREDTTPEDVHRSAQSPTALMPTASSLTTATNYASVTS